MKGENDMKSVNGLNEVKKGERGAVAILVAILIVVLIGFTALAIDIGHLFVAKNELQNAADAGALAGARMLYLNDGENVNPNANAHAYEVATTNRSENVAVDVNWVPGMNSEADCDVQRGHWSFTTGTFTAHDNLNPTELWDVSTYVLDTTASFINAVRVVARRSDTPVASYFARIFGYDSFQMQAEAVAYIGFAGSLLPGDADQPIAICKQAIEDSDGNFTCNMGRMLNSGTNTDTHNTAGWTNLLQPCATANDNYMRSLICAGGNADIIDFTIPIGATGGNLSNVMRDLKDCWLDPGTHNWGTDDDGNAVDLGPLDTDDPKDGIPDVPWQMTLPVIDCPGNNVSNCPDLTGAVHVEIVWILDNQDPESLEQIYDDWTKGKYTDDELSALIPDKMAGWDAYDDEAPDYVPDGFDEQFPEAGGNYDPHNPKHRWYAFVKKFNLMNVPDDNGDIVPAPYQNMAIYFRPVCDYFEPKGTSQGENFGVLAKIPVLVQ